MVYFNSYVANTGEDSDLEMIVGFLVLAVLLLIILACTVGCCVIWVRRKKTYPISSVYYSDVKSVDNFEGLQHIRFKYHRLVSCLIIRIQ